MSNTSKLAAIKKQLKKQPATPAARFQRPTPDRKKRIQLYVEPDVYRLLLDRFAQMRREDLIAPSLQKMIGAAILGLQDLPDKKLMGYLQELQDRDMRVKR
jgi:hypothetical protein